MLLLAILLLWIRTLSHPLQAPGSTPCQGVPAVLSGFIVGVLLGLLALTRAEGVLIAVLCTGSGLIGCWHCCQQRTARARLLGLLPWGCLIVGWLLALAPWTLHNAWSLRALNQRLADRLVAPLPAFVPLTLYGPLNLALANYRCN